MKTLHLCIDAKGNPLIQTSKPHNTHNTRLRDVVWIGSFQNSGAEIRRRFRACLHTLQTHNLTNP